MFHVDSTTGEGIPGLLMHLREEGDTMPWEQVDEAVRYEEAGDDEKDYASVIASGMEKAARLFGC